MPESLFQSRRAAEDSEAAGCPGFRMAAATVRALQRLKAAGFMIIGLGRGELFQGFATPVSCGQFLRESSLDDWIIPLGDGHEMSEVCTPALIRAAGKWLLDLDRSFIIGRDSTIAAAGLTGCTPLRIQQRADPRRNPFSVPSLTAAVERILAVASVDRRMPAGA